MSLPEATGCHAIVLAAGAGSRFGGGKLLAPFRGRPLIHWSVAAALSSRVTSVTAVLGARADDVAAALAPFADRRLSLVRCRQWEEGLSASLTFGLRTLPQDTRAVAIFLGDMPDLDPGLADRVLTEVVGGAPAAYPECEGIPGHPVAFSSELFPLIESLKGDQGARA
ncbi:nucleotidyltransferase family protein, partial [Qipengyuania pacifica]|uniref:nucleotidyltransferase family protein n=1 Tax=Qipengyuania pacifica TaxID=2860199 RepID=UPI0035C875F8